MMRPVLLRLLREPLFAFALIGAVSRALKNAGVNNAVAMELIGHESEAISRAYTHIEAEALKKAVNRLPDLMPTAKEAR